MLIILLMCLLLFGMYFNCLVECSVLTFLYTHFSVHMYTKCCTTSWKIDSSLFLMYILLGNTECLCRATLNNTSWHWYPSCVVPFRRRSGLESRVYLCLTQWTFLAITTEKSKRDWNHTSKMLMLVISLIKCSPLTLPKELVIKFSDEFLKYYLYIENNFRNSITALLAVPTIRIVL